MVYSTAQLNLAFSEVSTTQATELTEVCKLYNGMIMIWYACESKITCSNCEGIHIMRCAPVLITKMPSGQNGRSGEKLYDTGNVSDEFDDVTCQADVEAKAV